MVMICLLNKKLFSGDIPINYKKKYFFISLFFSRELFLEKNGFRSLIFCIFFQTIFYQFICFFFSYFQLVVNTIQEEICNIYLWIWFSKQKKEWWNSIYYVFIFAKLAKLIFIYIYTKQKYSYFFVINYLCSFSLTPNIYMYISSFFWQVQRFFSDRFFRNFTKYK